MKINQFIIYFCISFFISPVIFNFFIYPEMSINHLSLNPEFTLPFSFLFAIFLFGTVFSLIFYLEDLEDLETFFNPILFGFILGLLWLPIEYVTNMLFHAAGSMLFQALGSFFTGNIDWLIVSILLATILYIALFSLFYFFIYLTKKFINYKKNKQKTE